MTKSKKFETFLTLLEVNDPNDVIEVTSRNSDELVLTENENYFHGSFMVQNLSECCGLNSLVQSDSGKVIIRIY